MLFAIPAQAFLWNWSEQETPSYFGQKENLRPEGLLIEKGQLIQRSDVKTLKPGMKPGVKLVQVRRAAKAPSNPNNVTVTLTSDDVWGDGTGYQMLLDADATAYGTIIPETGPLTTSGNASVAVYAEFEYKIPANADGSLTTSNIVTNGNSVTIEIPAGKYDWAITNPSPGDRVWIASNLGSAGGRADDFVFEAGHDYEFSVTFASSNDRVDLFVDGKNVDEKSTDLVELPTGATVENWYAEGVAAGAVPEQMKVAFVGSDVYVGGLFAAYPDAWIKGTISGSTVTFESFQFIGDFVENNQTYHIWAVGADSNSDLQDAFTMTYDATAHTLTLDPDQYLLANASDVEMYYLTYYTDLTIMKDEPKPLQIDELPYSNDFSTNAKWKEFWVINANNDNVTWKWSDNGYAYIAYAKPNDDWLVSPLLKLEAGKVYTVTFQAHCQSSYAETIEVKAAKEVSAAALAAGVEVMAATEVSSNSFQSFGNNAFTVSETGYYCIGIHNISNDAYYCYVDDFEVKVKEPEDIEISPESGADIATALATAEEGKNVKNITINLAEGGEYTVSKTLTAPNNILLKGDAGNPATITMAEGMTDNIITLDGTTALAKMADGTDSDHKLIGSVDISGVKIVGIKGALVKDNQKTLVEQLTIADAIVEMPASGKNVLDFNGKGYVGEVVVKNSTIYANGKNTGFFAQYGSRPNNLKVDGYEVPLQIFDVQNSTIVNIANGKNFCDLKQNGTAQNVYVIKNNIFTDCGKPNQVVVGFNKGQTSATPTWDVDGNVFNCAGADGSAAEVSKTGKKNEEDIVKNSIEGVVTFTDAANGDFNGIFTAAPVEEPVEESASRRDAEEATLLTCGDPRWTILWKQGYTITIAEDIKFGSATADKTYAGEGTVVTITATANPADKFEVKSVKVEGKTSDLEVVVTPDAETPGKFTFTMPADAVVVSATFQRIAEDIIVNPEDIEGGDITAAINAKIEALAYTDPQTEEKVPGRVKNITINLAEGEAYTVAAAIKAPANVTINGNGATIDASGADANFIELQGSSVKAIKADGKTESDHYLIDAVTINKVTVNGLKKAIIRDTQKTLLKALTIENSVIEASDGKPALDFDGKGYIEQVTVNNSTVWSSTGTNKFFAKYGSRPKNLWSGDDAGSYTVQGFDVQNSTFVNIANSKNFCDISQKGTVNNVYTLKNNIFVNCGKSGQVVVGFNGGQTSATPIWDVDGNVFNYDGNDVSAAEVSKAGQKADEDIVKNSLTCRVLFSDVEKPDFGGILVLAPGTEAPETLPGDPRWSLSVLDGNTITVQTSNGHGTASAQYPYAIEGEEVGLTVKPEEGYVIESIVMLDADGYVIGLVTGDTFTMPGQDVVIYVGFKKTATGIDAIENDADFEEGEWYTINGVRIDKPTKKGLYIHNGKKIVIK